jgi:large subunit ribosomal protein L23
MFWKKDKTKKADIGKTESFPKEVSLDKESTGLTSKVLPKEYGVLKGFYISEKATALNSFSQYVFKVFDNATKNEVRKQVEKSFSVKVKGVNIINLPRKSRTIGRHSGFKPGFKKAIVALEKGYAIEQARQ